MHVRILDLDGAVVAQRGVCAHASRVLPLRDWGPRLRLGWTWPRADGRGGTYDEVLLPRDLGEPIARVWWCGEATVAGASSRSDAKRTFRAEVLTAATAARAATSSCAWIHSSGR